MIKKYRLSNKYTQEELANKIGVTKSFISKIEAEKTKPNLEMLSKIATALKVNIGDLIENKIYPEEESELKKQGVEWMVLGEELEEYGITPEQVKQWAEIVKHYTKK